MSPARTGGSNRSGWCGVVGYETSVRSLGCGEAEMSRWSAFQALTGSAVLATGVLLVAAGGPASVPGAATPASVPASRVLRVPAPAPHLPGLALPRAADGWLLGEPAAHGTGTGSAAAESSQTSAG